jgi:hypothetical protein
MATTTNFGWETPDDTDLVKDGALAIRTLGNSIDTSLVDLKGGTTGQVLSKASNTNMDFTWVAQDDSNAIQNAIVDAKGDLITATAADTPARLAVGTNGQYLKADSTTATGLAWASLPASGKLLQVVNADTTTTATSSSTTYIDTNLTATITPSSTSSKVLVTVHQSYNIPTSGNGMGIKLVRGTTDLKSHGSYVGYTAAGGEVITGHFSISYLDSPNTTSATTYKTQFARLTGASSASVNNFSLTSYITLMEIGA